MSKEWSVHVNEWSLHRVRPRRYLPRSNCTFLVCCGDWIYRLRSEWWVGISLAALRRRGAVVASGVHEWRSIPRPTVKKKAAAAAAGDGARHVAAMETTKFADLLPLVEHCALVRYDDGDTRVPGWITIKTLGAAWVVQIKDPDSANSFQFVSDTLDKALDGAALLLACDDAPWQPDAFLKKSKSK